MKGHEDDQGTGTFYKDNHLGSFFPEDKKVQEELINVYKYLVRGVKKCQTFLNGTQ